MDHDWKLIDESWGVWECARCGARGRRASVLGQRMIVDPKGNRIDPVAECEDVLTAQVHES